MTKPTIWIAAGGTGGHIYPALAVAKTMRDAGWQVHWVGCKDALEHKICKANAIQFWSIPSLKWRGLRHAFSWLNMFIKAMLQLKLIRRVIPADVVLCMGGYVALPTGIVSVIARTPLFIHEQNAVLGRTNRLLYPFIRSGFCAYPEVARSYPHLYQVGNPHSLPLQLHKRTFPSRSFKVLSLGGSQGAKQLNTLFAEAMVDKRLSHCEFWHVAGYQGQAMLALNNDKIKVSTYLDDIQKAYEWADLVVIRCGAMTLTEVSVYGIPALLLPYQYAKDNHQHKNATFYIERGAALWCATSSDALVQQIVQLSQDKAQYDLLAENMYRLAPRSSSVECIMQHIDTTLMASMS